MSKAWNSNHSNQRPAGLNQLLNNVIIAIITPLKPRHSVIWVGPINVRRLNTRGIDVHKTPCWNSAIQCLKRCWGEWNIFHQWLLAGDPCYFMNAPAGSNIGQSIRSYTGIFQFNEIWKHPTTFGRDVSESTLRKYAEMWDLAGERHVRRVWKMTAVFRRNEQSWPSQVCVARIDCIWGDGTRTRT